MDCIAIKFNLRAKASIRVHACWFWIRDEGGFGQTRYLLVWFAVRHTEPSVTYKAKSAATKRKQSKERNKRETKRNHFKFFFNFIFCALKGLGETQPVDIFVHTKAPTKIALKDSHVFAVAIATQMWNGAGRTYNEFWNRWKP